MNLTVEMEQDVLVATGSGQLSLVGSVRLWREIFDHVANRQAKKILADFLAAAGELSTLERYELGMEIAQYLRQLGISPACCVVGRPPALNGFAMLVAQNMGVLAVMFPTVEEARKWLTLPERKDSLRLPDE